MATAGDATVTTLSNILKTKYDQKKFYQFAYMKAPLMGRMRKDEKFGGNNARISVRYSVPQGGSGTFSNAQANKTTSSDVGFLLTRGKDYQVSGISGEALDAGEGDENSIYNALKGEMDGSLRNLSRSMAISMYRNGGGARGKGDGAYSVAGTVITLATPADITNFEVGMILKLSSTDGTSGAVRAGSVNVVGVNRILGTITTNVAVNAGVTSPVNTDFIFRDGDHGGASGILAKGLLGWLPQTAPVGGDNWFGVDRSVDTTRLAGILYNGQGGNKEETLIDAAAYAGREGATIDACYLNNLDRSDLVKSLGTKAEYEPVKSSDGVIGYKALIIQGEDGPIKVMADVNCPKGSFFMLQEDTWVAKSIKAAPRFLKADGPQFLREANADGYEWRMGAYWQIGCEAPGYNVSGVF